MALREILLLLCIVAASAGAGTPEMRFVLWFKQVRYHS